ncbi:MAG: hypothetical protein H7144_09390, partial [Burkholderiales bacterium]|nr:hypothetical protein [Phycisphaerae bacterium]
MSIRLKLILSICIPMLIGCAIVLIFDYRHSYAAATQFAQQRVAERAAATAAQINERLDSVKTAADATAAAMANRPLIAEPQLRG